MNIKSQKDFLAGMMFVIIGAAFAIGAYNYSMGDGARMGPGYFPRMLGVLLAMLGCVITFKALTVATADGEKFGTIAWKPLFCIIGANLLFGICLGGLPSIGLPSMGMMVGIFVLTFTASLAADRYKPVEVLILAVVLCIISYLAFIKLLNLQFPFWPAFLTN
jgi:Tripartite tricarboxylate transporter TctB family